MTPHSPPPSKNYKHFKLNEFLLDRLQMVDQMFDPLTGEAFVANNHIVICRRCNGVHHENSWKNNQGQCVWCNFEKSSSELEIISRIVNPSKAIDNYPLIPSKEKEKDNNIKKINVVLIDDQSGSEWPIELPIHATSNELIKAIKENLSTELPTPIESYRLIIQRNKKEWRSRTTSIYAGIKDGDILVLISSREAFGKNVGNINVSLKILESGQEFDVEFPVYKDSEELIEAILNEIYYINPSSNTPTFKIINKTTGQEWKRWEDAFSAGIGEGDTLLFVSNKLDSQIIATFKDKIADVPNEIFKKGAAYIKEYIKRIEEGSVYNEPQPLNECKLIFVGSGEVGKTSLIKRIVDHGFDQNESKTDGIEITNWSYSIDDKDVKLNIWDFGGQEIMHSTHKFFMTRRAIYILVINPRIQDQHIGEIELNYWLKLITSYAGRSPIIIAINKCEQHKMDLARGLLTDQFPQIIGFVETSCKENRGIEELIDLIGGAIQQLPHLNDIIPLSFLKVKEELENTNKDYLHYREYEDLCKRIDDRLTEDDSEMLISLLNDLGVMLNISENRRLKDTQVLNPEWITNGVYAIVNSERLIENGGIIRDNEVISILDKGLYPGMRERGFIMDMMDHFKLCYQIPDHPHTYFVPGAFPKDKPSTIEWEYDNFIHFQFQYDVLPSSIIAQFLVRMHEDIYQNQYWRNGAKIHYDGNFALIETHVFEKKITIKVAGNAEKRNLLSIIRRELHKIHQGISKLKVDSFIVLDPKGELLVNYKDLLSYQEAGYESYFEPKTKQKYRIQALLNGIEEGRKSQEWRKKISDGRIKDVLEELAITFPQDNSVIILKARLSQITGEKVSGTLDNTGYQREINNIMNSTLEVIDELGNIG